MDVNVESFSLVHRVLEGHMHDLLLTRNIVALIPMGRLLVNLAYTDLISQIQLQIINLDLLVIVKVKGLFDLIIKNSRFIDLQLKDRHGFLFLLVFIEESQLTVVIMPLDLCLQIDD